MAAVAATVLYERLKELGCPALDGVYLSEGKDIQKLLCTPSPHRLDIVEWICISVYPALREQFSSLKESQSDLKIEGMAKLGYDLMLCQADDLDLIKGKVCAQKQLHFLEQLLVVIPPQGNFTVSNSISDSSTFSSTEESFQEIAKKNEEFVKQVFSSSNLQAVLNPESHPWSSDIKALLLNEEVQQKRSLLSVTSHEETLLEALKELEEMVAALQELRTECPFLQGDLANADASCDNATALQTLKLIASDFNQLLVAFNQVYESELQKHCEHPAPVLSCCDPLFQAVHLSLLLCVQELQGLTQVTKTSECIVKTVKRQHGEKGVWSGSTRATLPSKLKELQQKYEAIHAALKDCQQS
ncbi:HAUS augmin-like complex subunit 7 isoform X2 [Rhineura floridana]|uniref:HAUS augmin-like complex subunit 7 isoform X2 n=1 Tax=Rhineura floridana TaxID=261503 RepID=UPI002AC86F60|nr:HAUS augmin-like complex subunit 7 isoform X2 [Rhineura floridana]